MPVRLPSITAHLDPLASGRLDHLKPFLSNHHTIFRSTSLREARPIIRRILVKRFTYLDPLASGRLDFAILTVRTVTGYLDPLASGRLDVLTLLATL